jgi:hypothetical protein
MAATLLTVITLPFVLAKCGTASAVNWTTLEGKKLCFFLNYFLNFPPRFSPAKIDVENVVKIFQALVIFAFANLPDRRVVYLKMDFYIILKLFKQF